MVRLPYPYEVIGFRNPASEKPVQRIAMINVRPDDLASTNAEDFPGLDTTVVY